MCYYVTLIHICLTVPNSDEPDCQIDIDCPSKMSCIQEQCENPCLASNPCEGNQECTITESESGRRIVACSCPDGLISTNNGYCQPGKTML
jgi:hypothetical protein